MRHARDSGLSFVPAVWASRDQATVVIAVGRLWEITDWLPGRADFAEHPSPTRLEAACTALARLHAAWDRFAAAPAPCPAVRRRLNLLREWHDLVGSGWQPLIPTAAALDPVRPVAERAWRLLPRWLDEVPQSLHPWTLTARPVQPCLCDLWHDHLLFDGDRLTGLVDYGAVKVDHVAVDLARLLGALVGDDPAGWEQGFRAYRALRPLSAEEEELARVLDRTGSILGVANWLRWLYRERRPFDNLPAAGRRLAALVRRIESWSVG
jgi:homoserine kinase type II